jgi:hypothetical protein
MTRSKVIEDADVVTYVVVRDPGDEAVAALEQLRALRASGSVAGHCQLPLRYRCHRCPS